MNSMPIDCNVIKELPRVPSIRVVRFRWPGDSEAPDRIQTESIPLREYAASIENGETVTIVRWLYAEAASSGSSNPTAWTYLFPDEVQRAS